MADSALPAPKLSTGTPAPGRMFSLNRFVRSYGFRSLLSALFSIWVAITFTFFLIRLLPSNPIQRYIDEQMARGEMTLESAQAKASLMFGAELNAPVPQQYLSYLGNILRGNLGESITAPGTPVLSVIAVNLPWTLLSVGLGLLFSFVVGLMLGILTAYWRNSPFDVVITTLASFLSATPNYLFAILIVVFFGTQLRWFSIGQMRGPYSANITPGFSLEFILDVLAHAFLPVLTYFISSFGNWLLTMKNSTLGVLGEEYVNAANARGLGQGRIMTAYVGRNASLPIFTHFALSIALAISGSVVIELYYSYPGIGLRLLDAVNQRDYSTIQGMFLLITVSVIVANLLTDILYERLDPRVRIAK